MDQEALVDALVEDGFLLDREIRRRGIQLDTPIAALDTDTGAWALVFGIPDQTSRRIAYNGMQDAIKALSLRLSLDQIVLVKATDPGLRELRSMSTPANGGSAWHSGPPSVEAAGRTFASPRALRPSPQNYESAVGEAIRSTLPPNTVFRAQRDAAERLSGTILPGHRLPAFDVDLLLETAGNVVLVEAKANHRPLGSHQVLSSFGKLSLFQRSAPAGQQFSMAVVAMAGFSDTAMSIFQRSTDFALITWALGEDPHVIRDALARLISER